MLIKTILFNLIILCIYCALIITGSADGDKGFNIALGAGMCIALQVGLNIIIGLVLLIMGKPGPGRSLLISGAVLIPVGFCIWLMLLSIYG